MSEKTKQPVGRPRTTLSDIPSNWKDLIMDCGQEGGSAVEMRCLLGIAQTAWETLLADYEEFRVTVEAAQDLCQVWFEKRGRDMITGAQGNATVWQFNMKNRFNWTDKSQTDVTSSDGSLAPTRIELVAPSVDPKD